MYLHIHFWVWLLVIPLQVYFLGLNAEWVVAFKSSLLSAIEEVPYRGRSYQELKKNDEPSDV